MVVHKTVIDPTRKPVKKPQDAFWPGWVFNVLRVIPQKRAYRSGCVFFWSIAFITNCWNRRFQRKYYIYECTWRCAALFSAGSHGILPGFPFPKSRSRIQGRVYQKRREYDSRLQFAKGKQTICGIESLIGGSKWSVLSEIWIADPSRQDGSGVLLPQSKKSLPVLRYSSADLILMKWLTWKTSRTAEAF